MQNQQMKQQRLEAAHRRRRIIFNSDAGDTDPVQLKVADPQAYLESRKTGLVGSSVDSIFYSTDQGFSYYAHDSEVSDVAFSANPLIKELIDQGTDPLQITVEFCRKNDIEIFWSFRTNDPHDSWTEEGPLSRFKKDHPEFLFGTREKPAPATEGLWTGVDYARPEVRDHVFAILHDVCSRYDLDGIEWDFFRMLTNFKSLAWRKGVSKEEREAMTGLLRRVRAMTDDIAARRQRPMLIAARVPDSVGYCHALGLDLMTWLKEDLIDIMVVGGYFWLQPWERSVELGHKHDVPVYPCLSSSRVGNSPPSIGHNAQDNGKTESLSVRRSDEAFQAHALGIWNAGADGVYLFNYNYKHPPTHRMWTDLGDPQKLATLDKIYHVSVMGRGHDSLETYLPWGEGERFLHMPTLCPDHARELIASDPIVTTIRVEDDLAEATRQGLQPEVRLNVQMTDLPPASSLSVKMNGRVLDCAALTWESQRPETWQEFIVDPQIVSKGDNDLQIAVTQESLETPCVCHDVHLRINYGRA
jgi:hypothetical protein